MLNNSMDKQKNQLMIRPKSKIQPKNLTSEMLDKSAKIVLFNLVHYF